MSFAFNQFCQNNELIIDVEVQGSFFLTSSKSNLRKRREWWERIPYEIILLSNQVLQEVSLSLSS